MRRTVLMAVATSACTANAGELGLGPGFSGTTDPTSDTISVFLDGPALLPTWIVLGDENGRVVAEKRIATDGMVEFEPQGTSVVSLVELDRDSECLSVHTIDGVPLGRSIRFTAPSPSASPPTFTTRVAVTLPRAPDGTHSIWIMTGCGSRELPASANGYYESDHCFVAGDSTELVVVARSREGQVLGWYRTVGINPVSGVPISLIVPYYDQTVILHRLTVTNPPSNATRIDIGVWGVVPGDSVSTLTRLVITNFAETISVPISFPGLELSPRLGISIDVGVGQFDLSSIVASAIDQLPATIDLGGDFPVLTDVYVTARDRPEIEWRVAGEGQADGVFVDYRWRNNGSHQWQLRSPRTRTGMVRFPELPDQFGACRPNQTPPETSVTLFDAPTGIPFEEWRLGQTLPAGVFRHTSFGE